MKHILLCSFALVLILSCTVVAQSPTAMQQPSMPLEKLLNPDGSMNTHTGFQGSVDPKGFRMVSDPEGMPRFVRSPQAAVTTPADTNWDDRFGRADANNWIYAMAVNGTDLYVGGDFTYIGNIAANRIAKWDGAHWSALGTGMNNQVEAIAVGGGNVYAGGAFTTAGGVSANTIAKWDGSSWSPLGAGMNQEVMALVARGDTVYAGGNFDVAGGVSAPNIAQWNGSSWSSMGIGPGGPVWALAVKGDTVYAGSSSIVQWDGTNWSALGTGMPGNAVRAIVVSGGDVYAAGSFIQAGGVSVNNIAKWDGTNWSALGGGIDMGLSSVYALAVIGGNIYAGGVFTTAGGASASNIAKWDGANWTSLGVGVEPYNSYWAVRALASIGTDLYAGGAFPAAGGLGNTQSIARWNGSNWFPVADIGTFPGNLLGESNIVRAIAVKGSNVYVGGNFSFAGNVRVNGVAKWNGTNWDSLGSGVSNINNPSEVYALAVNGTDLYMGGYFTTVGGVGTNSIAKWNGTNWSSLGTGMPFSTVFAIAVNGDTVYAGGQFTTAGGVSANNIAKWDGNSWSALGSGMNNIVYALAVLNNNLYAGGLFNTAGGNFVYNVAVWDGNTWSGVGGGFNGFVRTLATNGTDLFAGGGFTANGGVSTTLNYVAKSFGGTGTWIALGSGTDNWVRSLSVVGFDLYAGGEFLTAGGTSANYIAKWDEFNWSALGSGVNQRVRAVGVKGAGVYAGGEFMTAGGKSSLYFGGWRTKMPTIVDSISDGWNMVSVPFLVDDFQKSSVYPTASSSAFTYDGSYQPRNPLKNGEGYWVKWNGSQPIGYAGAIIAQESVAVNAGWNMVGSISVPILVSSITSDPGGVHTSQFFGFDNGNGYLPSDTVVPGRAYWVNVDQACKLIFSSSPSAVPANRIRITPTSEQPPPPPSDAHPASHIPHQFALAQNYPNPFNPLTFIRYQLPVPGFVTLRVFDLLGREIVTLVNETQTAGYKSVSFDASALPSGMYYYRLVAGSFTHVKKMVLVK